MNLGDLKVGESAVLVDFSTNHSLYLKLLSLGLLPGDTVEVISRSPFGGPISLKHGSNNIFAIRKKEASTIEIKPSQKSAQK